MQCSADSYERAVIVSRHKRKSHPLVKKFAVLRINSTGIPLTSPESGSSIDCIILDADRPYSIGRSSRACDYLVEDCHVSKLHCQLFFYGKHRKIYIIDGTDDSTVDEIQRRLTFSSHSVSDEIRVSLNGVYVNGFKLVSGKTWELSAGDEVSLACCGEGRCALRLKVGFIIQSITIKEEIANAIIEDSIVEAEKRIGVTHGSGIRAKRSKRVFAVPKEVSLHEMMRQYGGAIEKINCLSNQCRKIMQSDDPIATARHCSYLSFSDKRYTSSETELKLPKNVNPPNPEENFVGVEKEDKNSIVLKETQTHPTLANLTDSFNETSEKLVPPGNMFYLNRLNFMDNNTHNDSNVASLPELLHPTNTILRLFIATFTSDVSWFLSECNIQKDLPVTIACHQIERCWSSSPEKRTSIPYADFPHLMLVYPPFPEVIAFGKDRNRQGVACHHPKLFVLQREDCIRVIITSANLVKSQWHHVTNTVWWQDFPRRSVPNLLSLFSFSADANTKHKHPSDFAFHLAGFMASLLVDVPSQAYWITELAKYDFQGAMGCLVASVPGMFSRRIPRILGDSFAASVIGSVESSIVGINHLFHAKADSNGARLKKVASFFDNLRRNFARMSPVSFRRVKNIPADANAVSVHLLTSNTSLEDIIQLGFLPRTVAKWVSPLWDSGLISFSGYINPKELLSAVLGESKSSALLILNISKGTLFTSVSLSMNSEETASFSTLVASLQRCYGLSRLEELLENHGWVESEETDFFYGSSSIGSSLNAKFFAAFSAAVGKKSTQRYDSEESDPEWGGWSASQELKKPSMKIIYPSINTVAASTQGISPFRRILCLSEKTWQNLRGLDIWRDAVPRPVRRNHPMHSKVARRRFLTSDKGSYGWVYSGSHNFSPAAWGMPLANQSLSKLRICNYELGILFLFPPGNDATRRNFDDVQMPFTVPPPKYSPSDRPATRTAMKEALEMVKLPSADDFAEVFHEDEKGGVDDSALLAAVEKPEDQSYANLLWAFGL